MLFGSMLLALAIMLIPSGTIFAAEKQLKVAMVQWTGDTKACIGFRDGLKELGYAVEYTTLDANQDKTKLGHLLREILQPRLNEFDYVYTYGTTVTKATKQIIRNQVPQIFAIVLDPVGAGIVQSMESSGSNITGASNGISLALQLDTALQIVTFKTLGFLFNSREKNSVLAREQLRELAASRGIESIDLRSPPAMDSLKKNLQKLKDRSIVVDAVYMPSDSFMRTNAELIGAGLRAAKIKSFGATKEYVDGGVLMGLVPDYYKLGKAAARVVDMHQKGEKLQNIPVATDKEPTLLINRATARLLNVTIPAALLAKATFVE
jgi:putative ABC transport system substrate-binding protein